MYIICATAGVEARSGRRASDRRRRAAVEEAAGRSGAAPEPPLRASIIIIIIIVIIIIIIIIIIICIIGVRLVCPTHVVRIRNSFGARPERALRFEGLRLQGRGALSFVDQGILLREFLLRTRLVSNSAPTW